MIRFLCVFVLATLQSPSIPVSPSAEARPAHEQLSQPSRSELARAFQRFERVFQRHPPSGEELRELNRAFDRATTSWLRGNGAEALRTIDEATYGLEKEVVGGDQLLASLVARFDPKTASDNVGLRELRVRIEPLYRIPEDPVRPRRLKLRFVGPPRDGGTVTELAVLERPEWRSDGPAVEFQIRIPDLVPGSHSLFGEWGGEGASKLIGHWEVTKVDLNARWASNVAGVDGVSTHGPRMEAALDAFRSRNGVLGYWNSPQRTEYLDTTAQSLIDELDVELKALESGADPYRRREGDLWRSVRDSRGRLSVRVFAPPAACTDAKVPLVIALHGQGGDENSFFDGLGAGKIKQLATARRFLVAAPLVQSRGMSSEEFDALVLELGYEYAIDPERIYVVGHSMGAGSACALAASRRENIAAVACFAGGSAPKDRKMAPTHIWAGELDLLAKPERLARMAEKARAEGAAIECKVVPDQGHTLVVGAKLEEAIDWLLARRLPPVESAGTNKK